MYLLRKPHTYFLGISWHISITDAIGLLIFYFLRNLVQFDYMMDLLNAMNVIQIRN
jgi:hypothetical protein